MWQGTSGKTHRLRRGMRKDCTRKIAQFRLSPFSFPLLFRLFHQLRHDDLNRRTNLTHFATGSFTFGYDIRSSRTSLNRPNGVNTTYAYDGKTGDRSPSVLRSCYHSFASNRAPHKLLEGMLVFKNMPGLFCRTTVKYRYFAV